MNDEIIIDIEQYTKEGKEIPKEKGCSYKIKVDKQHFVVKNHLITGKEILELAGKVPVQNYRLDQKLRGGRKEKIELEQEVDLSRPGVERFITLPLDTTEG